MSNKASWVWFIESSYLTHFFVCFFNKPRYANLPQRQWSQLGWYHKLQWSSTTYQKNLLRKGFKKNTHTHGNINQTPWKRRLCEPILGDLLCFYSIMLHLKVEYNPTNKNQKTKKQERSLPAQMLPSMQIWPTTKFIFLIKSIQ